MTGEWKIEDNPACNLPQKLATGFTQAFEGLVGASYKPTLYIASQLVAGTNYMLICEQKLMTNPPHLGYVKVVLHEDLNGHFSIMSIDKII
ncbi:hypothetical protein [Methanimicrococcus blatticola]|uniref:Uncharacterized protein n=1 Tax=Methanimicrococcus blatticola TaxID=91560 RepID=A0A484F5L9_9EURY|nr:hypothetical protein [Methanimicrococcus blatticola]MBZ3935953.1 hypothetical protein [Methanimicrococcus blatticola]MCC2509434.1 hypothetical protein [Methanimicrococcus blatticola]TDQ68316.1 hypothetical protein C7391_1257 [Methanimicrococcus blatticola]